MNPPNVSGYLPRCKHASSIGKYPCMLHCDDNLLSIAIASLDLDSFCSSDLKCEPVNNLKFLFQVKVEKCIYFSTLYLELETHRVKLVEEQK